MDSTLLNLVIFIAGLAGNFVMAFAYDRFKASHSARAVQIRATEEEWRSRIQSSDAVVRAKAFETILLLALKDLIIGNVMFAISGLTVMLDGNDYLNTFSNIVAAITSIFAVFVFYRSISWIRWYFKLSGPDLPAAAA